MDRSITNGLGMKYLFYEDWTNKRIERIVGIFGKGWFKGKTVLELGSAHGDIGIELLKLGADVTFSDARQSHLDGISDQLMQYGYSPKTVCIDQNVPYFFNSRFDLILHLGVLYHIENWQQDLECALQHTNTMILESAVHPTPKDMKHPLYGPYSCENPTLTQEGIEEELTKLGCKFIRFDIPELDSYGRWVTNQTSINNLYSWSAVGDNNQVNHYRRFWLVLR